MSIIELEQMEEEAEYRHAEATGKHEDDNKQSEEDPGNLRRESQFIVDIEQQVISKDDGTSNIMDI